MESSNTIVANALNAHNRSHAPIRNAKDEFILKQLVQEYNSPYIKEEAGDIVKEIEALAQYIKTWKKAFPQAQKTRAELARLRAIISQVA